MDSVKDTPRRAERAREGREGAEDVGRGLTPIEKRVVAGIRLYLTRRREIEALGGGVYLVPSESRALRYAVSLEDSSCACADHHYTGLVCKHTYAAEVHFARRVGECAADLFRPGSRQPVIAPCGACFSSGVVLERYEDDLAIGGYEEASETCGSCRGHGVRVEVAL